MRFSILGATSQWRVSSTACELLEGSGVKLEDAGEHVLKGLPGSRPVFRLAR